MWRISTFLLSGMDSKQLKLGVNGKEVLGNTHNI